MATRDLTLGATYRRLHDLGFAATSATNPDRHVSLPGHRDSFISLADHAAAVFCRPSAALGCEVEYPEQRQVALLVLTGYLLADKRQSAVVREVLEKFGLLAGPCRIDAFQNQEYPLRYTGQPIFDGEAAARLTFDDDYATVFVRHAISPGRYIQHTDSYGRMDQRAAEPIGSHVIELSGEWRNGTLLDTPRDRLPELLQADVARIISDVESARWGARPLAKEVAA
ncbi:MAG TPA: hypothetical protein VGG63_16440 [Steroidobacteraceae bacterium]|jgi:hypothetical protein